MVKSGSSTCPEEQNVIPQRLAYTVELTEEVAPVLSTLPLAELASDEALSVLVYSLSLRFPPSLSLPSESCALDFFKSASAPILAEVTQDNSVSVSPIPE